MVDKIGSAAGTIWHFLEAEGECSVTKLIKETGLENKLAQRAIGWLAKEGKLVITSKGRTESVSLKK